MKKILTIFTSSLVALSFFGSAGAISPQTKGSSAIKNPSLQQPSKSSNTKGNTNSAVGKKGTTKNIKQNTKKQGTVNPSKPSKSK